MNQPRSIFEATQRFIMKHFVSQRCGSRPQNGIPTKILYHLSLPCQLSTPLLDFITFFQFQMHFTSLSNPYCLLFNMTWSPWVHDGRPLRPQWRIVGAMQIATRALWPWAPFNWDKARTVTWYVSGKVMKVTGFDIFTWNLAMTSDLLKVNQGRNSKQNSVIGGERCCHVFWNQTCSQHSTHSSWSISRHHFLDVLLEIRNESTHFNLSQIVPFINLQEKGQKIVNVHEKLSIHRHIFHVTKLVFCNTCFRWDIPVLSMWRLFLERCSHADSERIIDAGIEVSSETARRQRSFPELLNNVLHLRSWISLHGLWVQILRNRNSDLKPPHPKTVDFSWAILPKWPGVSGES